MSWLLSHYAAYRASNYLTWPNGRGRLYQPLPLVRAFELWTVLFDRWKPDGTD